MRSHSATVTVERSTEAVAARKYPSLMETLRAHYHDRERDHENMTSSWRFTAAFFWLTAVSVVYTSLRFTVPHLVGTIWGRDLWDVYWAKVIIALGFIQIGANWLCANFFQSYHSVTDDKPELTKTLWDVHPLEVGRKVGEGAQLAGRRSSDPRLLQGKYCVKCQLEQPPRAHHCKACRKCVLKRDHHCFILGSCVGYYNQRNFIVLTFYLVIGSFINLSLSYYYLRDFFSPQATAWDYFLPYTIIQAIGSGTYDFTTLLLLYHWYVFTWMGPMCAAFFIMSIISVYLGLTTHEFVKNAPLRIMTSRSENFRSVFGSFWLVNFIFPAVILFKQPGDGKTWPGAYIKVTRQQAELYQKTHRN